MAELLRLVTAFAGLAVVGWIGVALVNATPLALAITVLIGAFYVMGVFELRRFQQATTGLARLVDDAAAAAACGSAASLPRLDPWLARVPAPLQNAVRRRIEGEPVGLPGPVMAPSLAGLLVLLGMLGTFIGMVATLRGTGAALTGATDLAAVRDSLVAPVRGLGLAFGTSVAGVAASAALGLLTALCRRERVQVGQRLDARIASSLRIFSVAHQREESLALLRRQTELMPALVDGLQALMGTTERLSEASNARLLAGQERFHEQAGRAYAGLAASVDQTLRASLSDTARLAGETVQAAASGALDRVARDTAALQASLAVTQQAQIERLAARVEAGSATVADAWRLLLERQERTGQELSDDLRAAHDRFAATFEQRSASLLDAVAARLDRAIDRVADDATHAIAEQARLGATVADGARRSLDAAAADLAQHAGALRVDVRQSHAELASASADREAQRAAVLVAGFEAMAASWQHESQAAAAEARAQQLRLCETVTDTARAMVAQTAQQAQRTGDEVARLVRAADDVPRAAAELMVEWRLQLADAAARDHTLLDERAVLLATLGSVFEGLRTAATAQGGAVDALVASAAAALEAVGTRFEDGMQAQAERLAEAAAQVGGGAVEMASLGEAFGVAVQRFGEASDRMGAHLQRIDAALAASMTRSDEQLAYHVAQAREVIDLSILSQRQIIEELQRVAARAAPSGVHAA